MNRVRWFILISIFLFVGMFGLYLSKYMFSSEKGKSNHKLELKYDSNINIEDCYIPPELEPINETNGFVFVNGKYIEAPYKVAFYEGWLMINNIRIRKIIKWPIVTESNEKPVIPEEILKNAQSFDDLRIPREDSSWTGRMVRWIKRNSEHPNTEIRKFYESLPFVEKVTYPAPAMTCVTFKNGKKDTSISFGSVPLLNKKNIYKRIDRTIERFAKRLEKGDTYLFFRNGLELSFGKQKGVRDLKLMIETLESDCDSDEKINILRRMGILPDIEDKYILSLIDNFQPSDQLNKKIEELIKTTEIKPRTINDVPEISPAEMERRKLDESLRQINKSKTE